MFFISNKNGGVEHGGGVTIYMYIHIYTYTHIHIYIFAALNDLGHPGPGTHRTCSVGPWEERKWGRPGNQRWLSSPERCMHVGVQAWQCSSFEVSDNLRFQYYG